MRALLIMGILGLATVALAQATKPAVRVPLGPVAAPDKAETVKPAPFTASINVVRSATLRNTKLPDGQAIALVDEPDAAAGSILRELFSSVQLNGEAGGKAADVEGTVAVLGVYVSPLPKTDGATRVELGVNCRLAVWRAGQRTKEPLTRVVDGTGKVELKVPVGPPDISKAVQAATTACLTELRDQAYAKGVASKLP